MSATEWKQFTYLYHCGVNGLRPEPPRTPPDAAALLALADRQAAAGVVAAALRQDPGAWLSPAEALELRLQAAQKNLHNRSRMEAALEILDRLQARGFRPTVLKGFSLGVLYQYPECRSSSDTDLLVPKEQEDAVLSCLEELGFRVKRRTGQSKHSECVHPAAGLFEVHISYFDGDIMPLLGWEPVGGAEAPRELSLWGHSFYTLPEEDNLRYLTRHLLKHFAHEWTGLRVFYDTALWIARHRDALNFPRFWKELEALGADRFFHTVFSMLVRAGCFAQADFPGMVLQSEAQCALLEEDISRYDRETPDGIARNYEVWLAYVEHCACRRHTRYLDPKKQAAQQAQHRLLFPSREALSRGYPILKRCRWLYPAVWLHRTLRGLANRKRRGSAQAAAQHHPGRGSADADSRQQDRRGLLISMALLTDR